MLESLTAADHSIASGKMNYILLCVHSLVMGFSRAEYRCGKTATLNVKIKWDYDVWFYNWMGG